MATDSPTNCANLRAHMHLITHTKTQKVIMYANFNKLDSTIFKAVVQNITPASDIRYYIHSISRRLPSIYIEAFTYIKSLGSAADSDFQRNQRLWISCFLARRHTQILCRICGRGMHFCLLFTTRQAFFRVSNSNSVKYSTVCQTKHMPCSTYPDSAWLPTVLRLGEISYFQIFSSTVKKHTPKVDVPFQKA